MTNLPEKARKGDMLLTPGLAPGAVLEVSFSSATNSGWLEVVEAPCPCCSMAGLFGEGFP